MGLQFFFLLPCLLNATSRVLQMCVMEKKVRCGVHMFVQQIGNVMCSFSRSPGYLQLASNGISPREKEPSDQRRFKLSHTEEKRDIFFLLFFFPTFYRCAVWGVSHGLFLTLFHPRVAQECILEVQWIKMPCQRGEKKENLHSELSLISLPRLLPRSASKKFTFLT